MSITKTFHAHPDLLATPLSEREEWVGYLAEREQCKGELTNGQGSYCCLGALIHGRGVEPIVGSDDRCRDQYRLSEMSLGGDLISQSAVHGSMGIHAAVSKESVFSFARLNDHFKLTFPEISQLLLGNSVTKEYADGELS